ncbi:hypothetical protein B0J13DRAFT_644396 [Dactylonectria estremocensis]|uniref:Uncharacterized protein n=1 Tax=Dactylonectria estremocensis TaxID=1079267 RepID=A0A9P9JCQ4_9HYPO|nr:hypothetical protein B0J13DRAFT_644396 [Dactylonectria estremocensis]
MSWTKKNSPHQAFAEKAEETPVTIAFPPWVLDIFEVSQNHPDGHRYFDTNAQCLQSKASVRIVSAPLDLPRKDALWQTLEMFNILGIPDDFTKERLLSVSHSFGRSSGQAGSCHWFHFLCKNIDIRQKGTSAPEVGNLTAAPGYPIDSLPQADYSWNRAGFFLRVDPEWCVTLVCFGATPGVMDRLNEFIAAKAWGNVTDDPYILFDLVFEGLYYDVDDTLILEYANSKGVRNLSSKIPFAPLHNCAKHIIHIAEALESCTMLVDSAMKNIGKHGPTPPRMGHERVLRQLQECLQYRQSLFRSSQLRLNSLQKRIDNAITLSFNLVTQQDSMLMIQDSSWMKIIAVITMTFLPTTGVATIVGSQLFITEAYNDKEWNILATPLFWTMWWISIPLTTFWWTYSQRLAGEVVEAMKKAMLLSMLMTDNVVDFLCDV